MQQSELTDIIIRGCRVNNLKSVDLNIPRGCLTVITGVSGSGKSSLAFDTLYAEGQRRYVESLSSYARQFLTRMKKPECDFIKNLPPAVAIEQRVVSRNPRSTVGTSSEIDDYLRLLMARLGKLYAPGSGELVKRHTIADIVATAHTLPLESRLFVLAPISLPEGRTLSTHLSMLQSQGYSRVLLDDQVVRIDELLSAGRVSDEDDLLLLVDRLTIQTGDDAYESRLADSIEIALYEGEESCTLEWEIINENKKVRKRQHFSTRFESGGRTFTEPSPELFNFNTPAGACPTCEGFGSTQGIDPNKVIPNPQRTLYDDCVDCWRGSVSKMWQKEFISATRFIGFPIHTPYQELTQEQRDLLWHGHPADASTGGRLIEGIDQYFESLQREIYKVQNRVRLAHYRGRTQCPTCHGSRLREDALLFTYQGLNLAQIAALTVREAIDFFTSDPSDPDERLIAARLLQEIRSRLKVLNDVGLGYLTLDRRSNTLSGGESQRINLATRLGNSLVGAMYILDEPSIGLHDRDTDRLINVIKELRDQGNTVIVVEHDERTIRAADYLVDVGLKAGTQGGEIIFAGAPSTIDTETKGYTAALLQGRDEIPVPTQRRKGRHWLQLHNVQRNNLKGFDVSIPLGVMTVVTGVSGSGKSTLVREILYEEMVKNLNHRSQVHALPDISSSTLSGDLESIAQIVLVDQDNAGRSSRSNPATYMGAFDEIRALFAEEASRMSDPQIRSLKKGDFSFNTQGGRCERCKGEGVLQIPMQFMSDITVECDACHGKRFQRHVLEVRLGGCKGPNIYDLLQMTIHDTIALLREQGSSGQAAALCLQPLELVGLGYLTLGQSVSTLSGGENQRLKLAAYLGQKHAPRTLFIFDEPTTGLHYQDIRTLLTAFARLIEEGHTVLIIEHNMEVIKSADYLIDLGPEGGDEGGYLVAVGTPEEVCQCSNSYTAHYLRDKLLAHSSPQRDVSLL